MLKKFKNILIKRKIYWKFRHLINPKIWHSYYDNAHIKRRFFYSEYIEENKLKCIFEFGCASAPNLFNIEKNIPWDVHYFGYDISQAAIKFANRKAKKKNYFFTNKLNTKIIQNQLNKWDFKEFNLSIYDRVLYLLTEEEVKAHFFKYKNYFSKLIIDDFHNSNFQDKNEAYFSKNYELLLFDFGFKLINNSPSEHIIGQDEFFKRSSRRLIFEKF